MKITDNEKSLPINALLRSLRERMELTQTQMGARLGVEASYVSRLEKGMYGVSAAMAGKYSKVTGVPIKYFLPTLQEAHAE